MMGAIRAMIRRMPLFSRSTSAHPSLVDRDSAHDLIRHNERPKRTHHGEDQVIREIEAEYRQARERLDALVMNAER